MLRIVLTIVLPLLVPTAIYLVWLRMLYWAQRESGETATMPGAAMPWVWLIGAGAVLLVFVLFFVGLNLGSAQQGVYVPPRWENGQVEPGHIVPGRSP
jgi:hypothetical protein